MSYPHKAKDRVEALITSLRRIAENDPDQEVMGMAIPVLDAALEDIKASIPDDDPVVAAVAGDHA